MWLIFELVQRQGRVMLSKTVGSLPHPNRNSPNLSQKQTQLWANSCLAKSETQRVFVMTEAKPMHSLWLFFRE